uniref:Uncharacterized protein n=1 Tax=Heliothis virescens TaxID=7102 RepID=A0A2A4K7I1_HELVI
MIKIRAVLLILLAFSLIHNGKATTETTETSEDVTTDHVEMSDEEEESASIQVVNRDTPNTTITNDSIDTSQEEEIITEIPSNSDATTAEVKSDDLSEDLKHDSVAKSDIPEESDELRITTRTSINEDITEKEEDKDKINEDLSKNQEQIEVVADIAKAEDHDGKNEEVVSTVENENDWRSEHDDPETKKHASEPTEDESGFDDDTGEYVDTKIEFELKSGMDTRAPEKRRQKYAGPTTPRYREQHEEHGYLDSGPMRTFSEVVVPRYRPVWTRSGIIYTPTLLSMQSRSPFLDRLSGHWPLNRNHYSPEEIYPIPRPRPISAPHYEESKMIDDYNDYGSNTYSYTPIRKVTTPRPSHQIHTPPKFDVFQKLVEASNHPKPQKRTFSDFHQRKYPESYG